MKAKFLYFVTFFHQNKNYNSFFPLVFLFLELTMLKPNLKSPPFPNSYQCQKTKSSFIISF